MSAWWPALKVGAIRQEREPGERQITQMANETNTKGKTACRKWQRYIALLEALPPRRRGQSGITEIQYGLSSIQRPSSRSNQMLVPIVRGSHELT